MIARRNTSCRSWSTLAAIQNNSETPVLQLTDLHGDIVAAASPSETETKLLSTSDTSEYGVPTTSTPAKYSWLGAEQQPTELPSGEIAMGARSYIPQLGRFLQPDPRPGGSANAYAYTFGDPVNTFDPSGEFTVATPTWSIELDDREAQQATEAAEAAIRKAAEEAAARTAAATAARAAATAAAFQSTESKWEEEYAMGGSSLNETIASEGAVPGGGMQEEESGYGGSGGDDLHFITDKGGPGATCGRNSTEHKKCRDPKGGSEKEDIEACGVLGGGIGGVIGDLPGGFAGGIAGQKAAEKACKAV